MLVVSGIAHRLSLVPARHVLPPANPIPRSKNGEKHMRHDKKSQILDSLPGPDPLESSPSGPAPFVWIEQVSADIFLASNFFLSGEPM